MHKTPSLIIGILPLMVIVVILMLGALYMRHKDYVGIGGNTIVRCREGHLFMTIWVPGISLKSIRLGMVRFQYCPVGNHWTFVVPINESELTDEEKRIASRYHDSQIP